MSDFFCQAAKIPYICPGHLPFVYCIRWRETSQISHTDIATPEGVAMSSFKTSCEPRDRIRVPLLADDDDRPAVVAVAEDVCQPG